MSLRQSNSDFCSVKVSHGGRRLSIIIQKSSSEENLRKLLMAIFGCDSVLGLLGDNGLGVPLALVCQKPHLLLKQEWSIVVNSWENICLYCRNEFQDKLALNVHMKSNKCCNNVADGNKQEVDKARVNGAEENVCPKCKRMFCDKWSVSYHIRHKVCEKLKAKNIENDKLSCPRCLKTYNDKYYLNYHIRKNSCKPPRINTKCQNCSREFSCIQSLMRHTRLSKSCGSKITEMAKKRAAEEDMGKPHLKNLCHDVDLQSRQFNTSNKRIKLSSVDNCDSCDSDKSIPLSMIHADSQLIAHESCPICFDNYVADDCINLTSCSHRFCKSCLKMHIQISVKQGETHVMCPAGVGCGSELSESELRLLADPSIFAKWERRALERAVELDPTLHLCTSPDCTYVICWTGPEDGESLFDCPLCLHKRCIVCQQEPFHTGSTCLKAGKWQDTYSRTSYPYSTSAIVPVEDRILLRCMNVKRCQRCGQGVVKEKGCNKIKCRCGYRFCFACLSENAQCDCTPKSAQHGFIDNVTGQIDSSGLKRRKSPT
jgi:hypothetical protein